MIKIWCCFLSLFLALFVVSLYILITQINNINSFTYYICNVTNVVYPISLPIDNYDESWNKCDCGEDCTTYSPNIKLYSSLNRNVIIKESFEDLKYNYTFGTESCKKGEHIHILADLLNDTINQATHYINKSLDCYANIKKSEIVLDNSYNFHGEIAFVVISSLLFFGLSFMFILLYYNKIIRICNKKNNNERNNDRNNDYAFTNFEMENV